MTFTEVLLSWEIRPEIVVLLGIAAAAYLAGWRQLRRRMGARLRAGWRATSYLGGVVVLFIALMGPIDVLGDYLFSAHMVQHLLIIGVAAPMLWMADPFPFWIWSLPAGARHWVGGLLARKSGFRRALHAATEPGLVWLVFVIVLIAWHDPTLYSLAQGDTAVHAFEHLTDFFSAMAYWWLAVGAAPLIRPRLSRGTRIGLLLAMVPPMAIVGMVLSLSNNPIYPHYIDQPRLWGISVLLDQELSGVIMWIMGSMTFILGALILFGKLLGREEAKKPYPRTHPAGGTSPQAPGIRL